MGNIEFDGDGVFVLDTLADLVTLGEFDTVSLILFDSVKLCDVIADLEAD
jgi:hypothetical protein